MSYGGYYGGQQPPPGPRRPSRGPRQHQSTQMLPLPGREGARGGAGRQQPPPHAGPPRQPPRQRPPAGHSPRRRKRWGFGRVLMALVLVFVVFLAGVWVYLEFSINRTDALADYDGRPAAAAGTNWLIVGSDSREGLSPDETERLNTGDADGRRTDTIMVAHLPDNSTKPSLLSLPRDSEVSIPGEGTGKINSAFTLGGPQLLAKTVEQATGLRMDHYAEIGFGGFANVVDAIGGVEMDIPSEMHDTLTGVTIPAGKQELDGAQALGFVRMRHSEATPRSDLDRVANQRKFIGALVDEIASPATLLNPFDVFPLLATAPDALTMDDGDHLHNLVGLAWAMRGISSDDVLTTTVPTGSSGESWDRTQSKQLFSALENDEPIPESVVVN